MLRTLPVPVAVACARRIPMRSMSSGAYVISMNDSYVHKVLLTSAQREGDSRTSICPAAPGLHSHATNPQNLKCTSLHAPSHLWAPVSYQNSITSCIESRRPGSCAVAAKQITAHVAFDRTRATAASPHMYGCSPADSGGVTLVEPVCVQKELTSALLQALVSSRRRAMMPLSRKMRACSEISASLNIGIGKGEMNAPNSEAAFRPSYSPLPSSVASRSKHSHASSPLFKRGKESWSSTSAANWSAVAP